MPLAFMSPLLPWCGGNALLTKSDVNIIATYAIVNFIISIKDVEKRNTLHGIEVCNSLIIFGEYSKI
jgi:hypothetical protein